MFAPPGYVAHTRWSGIAASAVTIIIVVLAPLAGHVAARTYAWVVGLGWPGGFSPGTIERQLMTYEAIYVATFNVAMTGLTLVAAHRFHARAKAVLALGPPVKGARSYAGSILLSVVATILWFGTLLSVIPDLVVQDFLPYRHLMERPRSWLMPPIFCLLAPLAEELLFRGFLFGALSKTRLGFAGAAVITSAAWTALHVDRTILAQLQLFSAGLLLSGLLVRTGSLRIPIVCHMLFNTGVSVMVIVLGIPA